MPPSNRFPVTIDCGVVECDPWEFDGEDNDEVEEVPQNNRAIQEELVAQNPQLIIPLNL